MEQPKDNNKKVEFKLELEPLPEETQKLSEPANQLETRAAAIKPSSNYSPKQSTSPKQQQQQALQFPLEVRMKIISLADQCYVEKPNSGRGVAFIRKKIFKFVEEIEIFSDSSKNRLFYTIKADRVIDFSAKYHFHSAQKGIIGYTKQHGFKSLFRSKFEVMNDNGTQYFIQQKNPWTEVLESLLSMIPVVGTFLRIMSGYVLNPVYEVTTIGGDAVAEMRLKPSFWESKFELQRLQPLSEAKQELIILSLFTVIFMQAGDDDGDSESFI